MKKLHSLALTCLSLLAIQSSAAYAVNEEGAVTLSLTGGEIFLDSKRNMNNAGVGLLMLGYNFTERWAIEGLIGAFNTDFKNNNPSSKTVNGTPFAIDGIYRFDTYRYTVQPYVLAGIGVIGLNPNKSDANNEGNINAGVGAQIFVHKAVAFRVEARDFYTWVGGKNDFMVDAGLSFFFNLCSKC